MNPMNAKLTSSLCAFLLGTSGLLHADIYRILPRDADDKVIALEQVAEGFRLVVAERNVLATETWQIREVEPGIHTIASLELDKNLQSPRTPSEPLTVAPEERKPAQGWRVLSAENGFYRISPVAHPDHALSVSDTMTGALVGLEASTEEASNQFKLEKVGPDKPYIGVTGYTLHWEFQFGTAPGNNVRSIEDLQKHFTPDAPWGRINKEMQKFVNFLPEKFHKLESDIEAAKRTHQFEEEALVLNSNHLGGEFKYGNIESGAIVTNKTVFRPVIVEVLAKLPKGRAHWPSIWLYNYVPNTGNKGDEIDIMESQFNRADGTRDTRRHIFQNTHGKYTLVEKFHMDKHNRYVSPVDMSEDYHYYSCHWWPNGDVDMYVDNVRTVRRNIPWRGGPPNVIIYLSTGSERMDWPGPIVTDSKDGTDTFTPDDPNSTFKIRHIKIFKPDGTDVKLLN
jgi:hypothetical protein